MDVDSLNNEDSRPLPWLLEFASSLARPPAALSLFQFHKLCFLAATASPDSPYDTESLAELDAFVRNYVVARLQTELDKICTLDGGADWSIGLLPYYSIDDLCVLAQEFLFCRSHLTADELSEFVVLFADKVSFGRHHVHSYNALIQHYLPDMLSRQAPLVYYESPWSLRATIDMIKDPDSKLSIADLNRIAETFHCMTVKQRNETHQRFQTRLLQILEQHAAHWDDSQQHTGKQTHRIRFLGLRWGPATNVDDCNEGWPVPPSRVRMLGGTLYSSAQYLRLEYEILNEEDVCIHRQECYQQISFFPVLVQSVLCHTSQMPRAVQEAVGEDPEERVPYLILSGLCRIAISMEHRIINQTLTFPSTLCNNKHGNWLQTEVHTTREPDFEGSYNDARVRIALDGNSLSQLTAARPASGPSSSSGASDGGNPRPQKTPLQVNIDPDALFASSSSSSTTAASVSSSATGATSTAKRSKHTSKSIAEAYFRNMGDYLPVSVFFAAFGISSVEEMQYLILQHITDPLLHERAAAVLHETWLQVPFLCYANAPVCPEAARHKCMSSVQQAAWNYLYYNMEHHSTVCGGDRYAEVVHLLKSYYIQVGAINPDHPHQPLPIQDCWFRQAVFLAHQCASLVQVLLQLDNPDKHEYGGNKRLGPTGRVLCREWRNLFRKHVEAVIRKDLRDNVLKHTRLNLESLQVNITMNMCKQLTSTIRERVGQTGSKNGKEDRNAQSSTVQNLDMSNYISMKSHVRRIDMPVERIGKCETMRDVQPSTRNKYCPVESPDSKAGGLVRNLASNVRITVAQREWPIVRYLMKQERLRQRDESGGREYFFRTTEAWARSLRQQQDQLRQQRQPEQPKASASAAIFVFLNGDPVGTTQQPAELFASLKHLKCSTQGYRDLTIVPVTGRGQAGLVLSGHLPETAFVSTFYESGEPVYVRHILIYTDAGRILSPYFVVDQQQQHVLFDRSLYEIMRINPTLDETYLTQRGFVEYLNTQEENCCGMLADFPHEIIPRNLLARIHLDRQQRVLRYTHCQLHPATMNGLITNLIPSSHRSHAPRNQFAANMERQNCSHVSLQAAENFATYMRLMLPRHALVRTISGDILRETECGSGLLIHVLSLCFHGANIEDGFPISRQFTENASSYLELNRSYVDEISSTQHTQVSFENPYLTNKAAAPKQWPRARFDYSHVDVDGLPAVGSQVDGTADRRSVVINKVCAYPDREEDAALHHMRFRNIPEALRRDEIGRVARVMRVSLRGFRREMAAVQASDVHKLEAGDKVKLASGHKMTISFEFAPEDMPYCLDGSPVEGILDPTFCFRMVCNQMAEAVSNTAALASGKRYSAIAFSDTATELLNDALRAGGLTPALKKCVCKGDTGEILFSAVPYFVVTMQALHYLSKCCELARSRGPSSTFTHQAVEGRRRGGGIRFSDMDNENMMGHGATRLVHESTSVLGSNCHVPYCQRCQRQAVWTVDAPRPYCRHCRSDAETGFIEQQYAGVLFTHYQHAQGIQVLVETRQETPF